MPNEALEKCFSVTHAEREALLLMGEGMTVLAAADELDISYDAFRTGLDRDIGRLWARDHRYCCLDARIG